jgi:hypothetical protein
MLYYFMILGLMKRFFSRLGWYASLFAIIGLTIFGIVRVYYNLTDDFRLGNITYETPNRSEWEVSALTAKESNQINAILNQPFAYIGKGAQSYAFGSEDGKYVLKFFKFKHLRPSWFLNLLPPIPSLEKYRLRQQQRKERKLENVFAGYRLAFQVHRPESGLLYIHLNTTKGQFPTVTVFDKLGMKHQIDLDDVVFILQERVETARVVIHRHLQQKDLAGAKAKIDAIFDLYMQEYAKGIFDNDHGVMRNVGFVAERPVHLDVGKLKQNPTIKQPNEYLKDLTMVANRMAGWLRENEVEDYPYLKNVIESKIESLTGHRLDLP